MVLQAVEEYLLREEEGALKFSENGIFHFFLHCSHFCLPYTVKAINLPMVDFFYFVDVCLSFTIR